MGRMNALTDGKTMEAGSQVLASKDFRPALRARARGQSGPDRASFPGSTSSCERRVYFRFRLLTAPLDLVSQVGGFRRRTIRPLCIRLLPPEADRGGSKRKFTAASE